MFKKTKGQSTVEYILLATAVIAVMIFFTTDKNTGLQGRLGNTLNATSDAIGGMTNRLKTSQNETPTRADLPPVGIDVIGNFATK